MKVTQTPTPQPSAVLPEPSYVSTVLATIAAGLECSAPADTPVTDGVLRRAYNVAVATVTGIPNLPDNVANEVSEKTATLLPDIALDATRASYAQLLRDLAEAVR